MKSSSLTDFQIVFHGAAKISQQKQEEKKRQKKTSRIMNPLFDGLELNAGQQIDSFAFFPRIYLDRKINASATLKHWPVLRAKLSNNNNNNIFIFIFFCTFFLFLPVNLRAHCVFIGSIMLRLELLFTLEKC